MAEQTHPSAAVRCLQFVRRRSVWFWVCCSMALLGLMAGFFGTVPEDPNPSLLSRIGSGLADGVIFGGIPTVLGLAVRRSFRALLEWRRTVRAQRPAPVPPRPVPTLPPAPQAVRAPADSVLPQGGQLFGIGDLHHWIRDAAITRWNVGHYGDAVTVAAQLLSSRTQQRVLRFDLSERKLMQEVFGPDEPKPGTARLRFFNEPDEPTRRSRLDSARGLGDACYGIRNVAAHHADLGWTPIQAFGYLMMFSVLASWIEEAHVYRKD